MRRAKRRLGRYRKDRKGVQDLAIKIIKGCLIIGLEAEELPPV